MTKASEIMSRLDAVDVDEMLNGKAGYAFLTLDELVNEILGDEERGCASFQQTFRDVRDALREAFAELETRARPEGFEWPRYEDGEPVRIWDTVPFDNGSCMTLHGVELSSGCFILHGELPDGKSCQSVYPRGERVKRPKAIAADGEPLEQGQTVYATHYGYAKCTVLAIEWAVDGYLVEVKNEGGHKFRQTPDELTHQRPVLDADGVPIKEGDTVYLLPGEWCDRFPCFGFHGGEELNVIDLNPKHKVSGSIRCRKFDSVLDVCFPQPSQLTHTKPEPTDDERRAVARRLRGPECKHKWRYQIMNDEKRNDVSNKLMDAAKCISKDDVACVLNDALHGEKKLSGINENCSTCCSVSLAELADLVKPSCDRDALLNLAGELDRVGFNDWLHSGEWEPEEIARRIRKALGAVE